MPRIVDKEAIKIEIMEAFARLSDERPLTAVSLREIAAEAGMSHTNVLRYFESKNSLHVATVHWASTFIFNSIETWFKANHLSDYPSRREYLDAFFTYFQTENQKGVNPRDVVMTCALGAYSPEIKAAIREEFARANRLFDACFSAEFGRPLTEDEISTIFLTFFGIYFARFNDVFPRGTACSPTLGFKCLISD